MPCPAFGVARRCLAPLTTLSLLAGIAALPRAAALDRAFESPSTLAPHVTPINPALDATIASMVRRGLLAPRIAVDSPSESDARLAAAPETMDAATATPGRTQWRPAGQPLPGNEPAQPEIAAPMPTLTLAGPRGAIIAASPKEPSEHAASTAPALAAPSTDAGTGEASPVAPGNELDDMAPIDELADTPAPTSDAPGDPVEPELTGEAVADALLAPAKPLSAAPKLGGAELGEPDRPARPSDAATAPTDPKNYEEPEESAPAAARPRPITKNQRLLRDKVRRVLKYYYNRPLNTGDRSPWEVMHAMLAFEVHSRVLQGGPNGDPITAVGWLCFNQPCKNRTLMYLNEDDDLRVKVGPALQGHHGQLLALLAQARVRSDYPLKVDGKDFTVADLIEVEKETCYPRTELTFKLIGLQRYLPIDAKWVNDQGMAWDFPTLVSEEMRQPVRTAACGGTHRLAGLAMAVKRQRASGLPVDGVYAEAAQFVANYQNYAYRLQNPDGSFSTEWFKGPGAEADIDRRLKTTGHMLELLLYAGSEEQLQNYRTVRAVNYLTNIMYANRDRDWEAGPLGHAIHALVLYDRMAFARYDQPQAAPPVAQKPQQMRAHR
jgi:hypothetical protein